MGFELKSMIPLRKLELVRNSYQDGVYGLFLFQNEFCKKKQTAFLTQRAGIVGIENISDLPIIQ